MARLSLYERALRSIDERIAELENRVGFLYQERDHLIKLQAAKPARAPRRQLHLQEPKVEVSG